MRWTRRRTWALTLACTGVALAVAASGSPRALAAGSSPVPSTTPSPTPSPPPSPTAGPSGLPKITSPGTPPWGLPLFPGSITVEPQPSSPAPSSTAEDNPGLFDIRGHIQQAIDDWFRNLVQSALDPVLSFLGQPILATPCVADQNREREL